MFWKLSHRSARTVVAVLVATGISTGVGMAAAYESEKISDDDFNKVVDVNQYDEGNVQATTLAMVRGMGIALHNDNLKLQAQVAELKAEVERLIDEVRQLATSTRSPR